MNFFNKLSFFPQNFHGQVLSIQVFSSDGPLASYAGFTQNLVVNYKLHNTPVLHNHRISTSCWHNDGLSKENQSKQVIFSCFFIAESPKRNSKNYPFSVFLSSYTVMWKHLWKFGKTKKKKLWFKQLPVG